MDSLSGHQGASRRMPQVQHDGLVTSLAPVIASQCTAPAAHLDPPVVASGRRQEGQQAVHGAAQRVASAQRKFSQQRRDDLRQWNVRRMKAAMKAAP